MLKKNPYGMMGVRCTLWHPEQVLGFLQIVHEQAHRWENVVIYSRLDAQCMQMLDVHAPLLKSVDIRNAQGWTEVSEAIGLSAPALSHVYLDYIYLRWDSPPLAGLKYPRLARLKQVGPTLAQLITILRVSPQLEWLALELNEPKERAGNIEDDLNEKNTGTIQLPVLMGLKLKHRKDPISKYLVGRIEAPNCRLVWADIDYDELLRSGSNSLTLAKRPMQHSPFEITTIYDLPVMWLEIRSLTSDAKLPTPWDSHRSELGGCVRISCIPYGLDKWTAIVDTLELSMEGGESPMKLHIEYPIANFSADDIAFWSSTSSIKFHLHYYRHTSSVLQYLSDPVVNDGGVARWPCPQLASISFVWFRRAQPAETTVEALAVVILGLLGKRMAARCTGEAPFEQALPKALRAISGPELLINKLHRKVPEGVELHQT